MEMEIPDVTESVIISSSSEEINDEENQLYPVATPVFEEIPPLNRVPVDSSDLIAEPLSYPEGLDAMLYSPHPNTTALDHSCTCANHHNVNLRKNKNTVPSRQSSCAPTKTRTFRATLSGGKLVIESTFNTSAYKKLAFYVRPLMWRTISCECSRS